MSTHICDHKTPKFYHFGPYPWTLRFLSIWYFPEDIFLPTVSFKHRFKSLVTTCISINYFKKGCVCVYECNHVYLWPWLGQDRGTQALCAIHAKVDALGGCEGLIRPHQVKQVWGRTSARSRDWREGGCSGRTCCHSSKKVISTVVNSLSRCWHLTPREGIPLSKVSIAARSWCYCNKKKNSYVNIVSCASNSRMLQTKVTQGNLKLSERLKIKQMSLQWNQSGFIQGILSDH